MGNHRNRPVYNNVGGIIAESDGLPFVVFSQRDCLMNRP